MPSVGSAPNEPSSRDSTCGSRTAVRRVGARVPGARGKDASRALERRRIGRDGYETDTTLTVDDAVDDDDDDGDEALATFSSSKTIHESADVVRIAPFPAPPVIEEDEASPVDWAPALPPRDRWPADLADLFANNPAGAQTWTEVETAMQRLVSYHAVRDTTHLSLSWRAARDAPAHARDRARAHARRCSPTLLACCKSRAHVLKSLRGTGDAVAKRRHRSPLGTKGLRPIV